MIGKMEIREERCTAGCRCIGTQMTNRFYAAIEIHWYNWFVWQVLHWQIKHKCLRCIANTGVPAAPRCVEGVFEFVGPGWWYHAFWISEKICTKFWINLDRIGNQKHRWFWSFLCQPRGRRLHLFWHNKWWNAGAICHLNLNLQCDILKKDRLGPFIRALQTFEIGPNFFGR